MGRPRRWSDDRLLARLAHLRYIQREDHESTANQLAREGWVCPVNDGVWTTRAAKAGDRACQRYGIKDAVKAAAAAGTLSEATGTPPASGRAPAPDTQAVDARAAVQQAATAVVGAHVDLDELPSLIKTKLTDLIVHWGALEPVAWQREALSAESRSALRQANVLATLYSATVALHDRSPASATKAIRLLGQLTDTVNAPEVTSEGIEDELAEIETLADEIMEGLPLLVQLRGLDAVLSRLGLRAEDAVRGVLEEVSKQLLAHASIAPEDAAEVLRAASSKVRGHIDRVAA